MGHYDEFREESVTKWGSTAPKDPVCAEIDKLKQDVLQLKYDIKSLRREIEMALPEGSGRYDNLHGDEDEVQYTWDELEEFRMQEADLQNDADWLENHE